MQTVDNELSALARLTFYENLVSEQVSVLSWFIFRGNVKAFPRNKEN